MWVNPGKLNKRITLQRSITDKDASGRPVKRWVDVATVWAAVRPLRGREYHAAAANNAEGTKRVEIRYRKGITTDMRVLYGGRILEINSPPIDPDEQHKELHLMCREWMPGG